MKALPLPLLIIAIAVASMLLPTGPDADPSGPGLQPPLAEVEVVQLSDGRHLIATSLAEEGGEIVLDGGPRQRRFDQSEVEARWHHRYLLGSDRFGRDLLSRLLGGARLSLVVAGLSLLLSSLLGLGIGLAAATCGGLVDGLLMRLVDSMLAIPLIFLLILMSAVLEPGPGLLIAILGGFSWMGLARLTRGQALAIETEPWAIASRLSGSPWWLRWREHHLPHLVGPLSQDAALRLGDLIIAEATLSFLGLGLSGQLPSLGSLVADGQQVLRQGWWLATFPGLTVAALVAALALAGESLHERLRLDEHEL